MKRSAGSRTRLFLLEFIIVLFFFMLVCAVCVRIFSLAELTSKKSKNLSISQNLAQSFAEAWKGSDGSFAEMKELLPELSFSGQTFLAWYDGSWQPCSAQEAVFSLEAPVEISSFLKKAALTIRDLKKEETLFQLELCFYDPDTKKEGVF